mgnify:FL=1
MKYDFDYISTYILEYDAGVPKNVIFYGCAVVGGMIILISLISTNGIKFIKNASWCLLLGYVFFVLSATILFRQEGEKMQYVLRPLWSYSVLYSKLLAQNLLNILMFIPIGFLSGVAMRNVKALKIVGMGFVLSVLIEVIQLLFRRGVCNIDDVIHNTLGCAVGILCYLFCYKMVRTTLHLSE